MNVIINTVIVTCSSIVCISIIAQGQCIETFNPRTHITYMNVVINTVVVTFSSMVCISMVASGQYIETFNTRIPIAYMNVVIKTTVVTFGSTTWILTNVFKFFIFKIICVFFYTDHSLGCADIGRAVTYSTTSTNQSGKLPVDKKTHNKK